MAPHEGFSPAEWYFGEKVQKLTWRATPHSLNACVHGRLALSDLFMGGEKSNNVETEYTIKIADVATVEAMLIALR